jgi:hypothetical protein
VSEGDRLSISIDKTWLGHGDDLTGGGEKTWDTSDVEKPFDVQIAIESGLSVDPPDRHVMKAFKEPRSLSEASLMWHWSLSASTPGDHKILIQGLPLKTYPLELEMVLGVSHVPLDFALTLPDGTLQLNIKSLTSLGLTSRQQAWLKALQASAAFLGVILAYPFFKRVFDREPDDKNMPAPPKKALEPTAPTKRPRRGSVRGR